MLGAHWHVSSGSRLLTNRKQTDNIVRPLRCEMDDLKGNSTWGGHMYLPENSTELTAVEARSESNLL